jgi:CBS domain-containing protein
MTKKVIVASQTENLLSAMNKLITNDVQQLPVVEDGTGRLSGTITLKDAIRTYDQVANPNP